VCGCSKSVRHGTTPFVNQAFSRERMTDVPLVIAKGFLVDGLTETLPASQLWKRRRAEAPRPAHRSCRATYLIGWGHRQLPLLGSLLRVCCRAAAADSRLASSLIRSEDADAFLFERRPLPFAQLGAQSLALFGSIVWRRVAKTRRPWVVSKGE
jgi:hypothetical protein